MLVENILELYVDYLMVTPDKATATQLSQLSNGIVSHDCITRFLSSGLIDSKRLWLEAKPICYEIKSDDAVLIFDDSIQIKPHMDVNELVCWHYDHCSGRSVKGINFLSLSYQSQHMTIPVAIDFVRKNKAVVTPQGGLKYENEKNKNQLFREMIYEASRKLNFNFVLSDSWYSSSQNMKWIAKDCQSNFIMAIKSNRQVALSQQDKLQNKYVGISTLKLEGCTQVVYLKQLDFPVVISKQHFKNKDGSTGTLYLASNDENLSYDQMTAIYQRRWKAEEYHRSLKMNSALGKSTASTPRSQESHFISAAIAFIKMEILKVRCKKSSYAIRQMVMLNATAAALNKLRTF